MGIVTSQLEVGLLAWVLGTLWLRKTHTQHTYFTAYVALRLVQKMILFPILFAYGQNAYSEAYWLIAPIMTAALVCLLCEFWRSRWIVAVGIGLGLAEFLAYHLSMAWQPTFYIERGTVIIVCIAVIAVLIRSHANLLAIGVLLLSAIPAITYTPEFMQNSRALRFIPNLGYLLGLMAWIVWARRLEPVTASE